MPEHAGTSKTGHPLVTRYGTREFMGRVETGSAVWERKPNTWRFVSGAESVFGYRRTFPGDKPPGFASEEEALVDLVRLAEEGVENAKQAVQRAEDWKVTADIALLAHQLKNDPGTPRSIRPRNVDESRQAAKGEEAEG